MIRLFKTRFKLIISMIASFFVVALFFQNCTDVSQYAFFQMTAQVSAAESAEVEFFTYNVQSSVGSFILNLDKQTSKGFMRTAYSLFDYLKSKVPLQENEHYAVDFEYNFMTENYLFVIFRPAIYSYDRDNSGKYYISSPKYLLAFNFKTQQKKVILLPEKAYNLASIEEKGKSIFYTFVKFVYDGGINYTHYLNIIGENSETSQIIDTYNSYYNNEEMRIIKSQGDCVYYSKDDGVYKTCDSGVSKTPAFNLKINDLGEYDHGQYFLVGDYILHFSAPYENSKNTPLIKTYNTNTQNISTHVFSSNEPSENSYYYSIQHNIKLFVRKECHWIAATRDERDLGLLAGFQDKVAKGYYTGVTLTETKDCGETYNVIYKSKDERNLALDLKIVNNQIFIFYRSIEGKLFIENAATLQ